MAWSAQVGPRRQRGVALLMLLVLVTLTTLATFLRHLTPEANAASRQRRTELSLAQARAALYGFALRYRDLAQAQDPDASGADDRAMYGYLPFPDLGSSRNNNPSCAGEGCEANYYGGLAFDANGMPPTVVGRFPWKTLGTEVLRDGAGECLWLIVSGSHGRILRATPPATPLPLNWDSLSHLEIAVARDASALQSQLANLHERPLAVVFAPGGALPGQNRAPNGADLVDQCGGNYDAANYLEAINATLNYGLATARDDTTNRFAVGAPDGATTIANAKPVSIGGKVSAGAGRLRAGQCADCEVVGNDHGLPVEGESLFRNLRGGRNLRTDIGSLLDRVRDCLRDQIEAGSSFAPQAIPNYTAPGDKTVGRLPSSSCYDDDQAPRGYFSNYWPQMVVARPNSGSFTVTTDAVAGSCTGVLLFANQRGTKSPAPIDPAESATQLRTGDPVSVTNTALNTDWLANYFEDGNLSNLAGSGASFTGALSLLRQADGQALGQDLVRCIPAGASLQSIPSNPALAAYGGTLAAYSPGTRTVTLGVPFASPVATGLQSDLYGCVWTPETRAVGGGMRAYFRFRINDSGSATTPLDGFSFAMVDGGNPATACGAARQHLGYSGNNLDTPPLAGPKIGIEFDLRRNFSGASGFNASGANTLTNGRADPNFAGGHSAIVYWGGETDIATTRPVTSCAAPRVVSGAVCYLPDEEDDNVHGYPGVAGACGPPPSNPVAPASVPSSAPYGGVNKLDPNLSSVPVNQDFHVRVEVTRIEEVTTGSSCANTVRLAASGNIVRSLPGSITVDGLVPTVGDRLLLLGQSQAAENGVYVWNGGGAPLTRAADADSSAELANLVVRVLEGGVHGGRDYVQNRLSFGQTLETDAVGFGPPKRYVVEVWLLADSLTETNRIAALRDTTRPLAQLYPGFVAHLNDRPLIYHPFTNARLGFTVGQSTSANDQTISINDFFATWVP